MTSPISWQTRQKGFVPERQGPVTGDYQVDRFPDAFCRAGGIYPRADSFKIGEGPSLRAPSSMASAARLKRLIAVHWPFTSNPRAAAPFIGGLDAVERGLCGKTSRNSTWLLILNDL